MAGGLSILLTLLIVLVIVGIVSYIVSIFNGLIRLKNNIRKSLANIDVLLKQRHDELPNLVNTVMGYMRHEKSTLLLITKARTEFLNAHTLSQKAAVNDVISNSLKSIFAVAENYPVLKANENFLTLQKRISEIENSIADRREFYNDSVNLYNIRIESIPDVVVARMLNYQREDMFTASDEDKKNIDVKMQ